MAFCYHYHHYHICRNFIVMDNHDNPIESQIIGVQRSIYKLLELDLPEETQNQICHTLDQLVQEIRQNERQEQQQKEHA